MSKKSKKKQSKKETKKAEAKKAVKTMCRIESAVICLGQIKPKGKVGYDKAVERADHIYSNQPSGGKPNLKEAKYAMSKVSKVMSLLGLIEISEGTITRLK